MSTNLSPAPSDASAYAEALLDSPSVAAGWRELADAVCAPREEVRDAEAQ